MSNVSYWVSFNFIVVCAVSVLIVLLAQNRNIEKNVRGKFCLLCGLMLAESFAATADELAADYVSMIGVRFLAATLGYFLRPFMFYVILLVSIRESRLKNKLLCGIPLVLELLLLSINLPLHFMFYYFPQQYGTGNQWQITGGLYYFLYVVLVFYMAAILVSAVTKYRKKRSESIIVFVAIGLLILDQLAEIFVTKHTNMRESAMALAVMAYYVFFVSQTHFDEMKQVEVDQEIQQKKDMEELLSQTIETLSSSIDAKDRYTQGHSSRVAQYSLEIAMRSGYSEEECKQIYYAGLLHDIGKIGIPEQIINKPGKLTEEEYELIKSHPIKGKETLDKMKNMPYLSLGAYYHHERYDGKGYPRGLAEKNIPTVGRIIAVADAYDAMTSKRSYRSTLPQAVVREQILKGSGTQFDPKFAKIMLEMIDNDKNYNLREKSQTETEKEGIHCDDWWSARTRGFRITEYPFTIHFKTQTKADVEGDHFVPSVILFDSDDGMTGEQENEPGRNDFREYALISSNARTRCADAKSILSESDLSGLSSSDKEKWIMENRRGTDCTVTAVRYANVIDVTVSNGGYETKSHVVLYDSYSWSYLAITGEHCFLSEPDYYYAEEAVGPELLKPGDIPVKLEAQGDLPNLECDGWGRNKTDGIRLDRDLIRLKYRTKTYPKAKRLWHSSILLIYTAEGEDHSYENASDYFALRSDGEFKCQGFTVDHEITVSKDEDFVSWEQWLEDNKKGTSGKISVLRMKDQISFESANAGVTIKGMVRTPEGNMDPIYVALGGELCSITDIHLTTC